MTGDAREYLSLARGLASGHGFSFEGGLLREQMTPLPAPGYPVFLAVLGAGRAVTTDVPAAVKIAQAIAGGIAVVLLGFIGYRVGGRTVGIAAAWIAALSPPLIWISAFALTEAIVWPMGLLAACLFDRAVAAGTARPRLWMLACGLVVGLTVLVRPVTVLMLPLAWAWLAWRRRGPGVVLALACGAALVVLPWTGHISQRLHRFALVAANGGVTFWTGNHPLARGDGDLVSNPELRSDYERLRAQHRDLSDEDMEPVLYRDAFAWMRAEPRQWLALEVRKLFYLIVPVGPSYAHHGERLYHLASVWSYLLPLPFAIAGFARMGRRRAQVPGLWLLAGSTVWGCLLFMPQERYRIPNIDSAVAVSAGACFARRRSDGRQ
jgi:4-amino-4-deoxy-L-arabinose transferase-like glycosyltransferase